MQFQGRPHICSLEGGPHICSPKRDPKSAAQKGDPMSAALRGDPMSAVPRETVNRRQQCPASLSKEGEDASRAASWSSRRGPPLSSTH